jgi:hypothetical protein
MRRIVHASALGAVTVVVTAMLAGCGSHKPAAAGVASCLNDQGWLVEATGARVDGTAPDGISLTLTMAGKGTWRLATSYGPTASPLTKAEHAELVSCLRKRSPPPGTLRAPAAR